MSDVPFHCTRLGQRFYESTMPELVRQLTRLNDLLERVVERRELVRDGQREEHVGDRQPDGKRP